MKKQISILLTSFLIYLLCTGTLPANAASSFSFLVIGDTRTEPFLTGGAAQKDKIMQVLKERYRSNEKNTELIFDNFGERLLSVKITKKKYIQTIKYKNGWPELIAITDRKNNKKQVIMRSQGRKWVNDQIVTEMQRGSVNLQQGASFIIHGGDIALFGFQGKTFSDNPYYQLFNKELLLRLPVRPNARDLPGNLFAAVGNHATWYDDEIAGFRSTLPWLKKLGFTARHRIYSFVHNNCSFIFLDSGGWTPGGTTWSSRYPAFKAQMAYLTNHLETAKQNHRDHVFVIYHKPSFNKIGHDMLPKNQNPHEILKKYAKNLSIFVFNSHVHTTEHYLIDGINYQVIGGSGAPQNFKFSRHASTEKELYWQGNPRVEEYNYLKVEVNSRKISGTIYRFRPLDTLKPFTHKVMFQ